MSCPIVVRRIYRSARPVTAKLPAAAHRRPPVCTQLANPPLGHNFPHSLPNPGMTGCHSGPVASRARCLIGPCLRYLLS